MPSENPRLNSDERGLVISDFVDRVGDPVGIVASDGTTHRGEVLLADALSAMLYEVTNGRGAGRARRGDLPGALASGNGRCAARRLVGDARVPHRGPGLRRDRSPHRTAGRSRRADQRAGGAVRLRWQRNEHHPGRRRQRQSTGRPDGPAHRVVRRPDRPGCADARPLRPVRCRARSTCRAHPRSAR